MKRGEICRLICKPEYAYGEGGSGDKIPPHATLIFEIELFDFVGEDLSEGKDQSIIRRTLKKGESWTKPNEGASVEVVLKGTHENQVFDERTVTFTVGEGFLQNIPEGFVFLLSLTLNFIFSDFSVSNKRLQK
jgi:FK506-binding protein 4/5